MRTQGCLEFVCCGRRCRDMHIFLWLASVICMSFAQNPLIIVVVKNPVSVLVGENATLSVSAAETLQLITWKSPAGILIITKVSSTVVTTPSTPYTGRVDITVGGSLIISTTRTSDSGKYTVNMSPEGTATVGSSASVTLDVYEKIVGVSLGVAASILEGQDLTLLCNWVSGTKKQITWQKDGVDLSGDSRYNISDNKLSVLAVSRDYIGNYSCTVQNPVSEDTAVRFINISYGPDQLSISKASTSDCISKDDEIVGNGVTLTCTAASNPSAAFTWTFGGKVVSRNGRLSIVSPILNDTGTYTCIASNTNTQKSSNVTTSVNVVGESTEQATG
nr:PREDICTED: carcinoembryonic antigen-related cell adhesion molecule 6-like [Latimeria chalumnae]|eukprot:XP_005999208.1 PREDICTED: carcinoembryonic antigen-related cell adhesion molecule 6-like [Latimeria chalumnae]